MYSKISIVLRYRSFGNRIQTLLMYVKVVTTVFYEVVKNWKTVKQKEKMCTYISSRFFGKSKFLNSMIYNLFHISNSIIQPYFIVLRGE